MIIGWLEFKYVDWTHRIDTRQRSTGTGQQVGSVSCVGSRLTRIMACEPFGPQNDAVFKAFKRLKKFIFSVFFVFPSVSKKEPLSRDRPKIAPPYRSLCATIVGGLSMMKKTPKGRSGTPLSKSVLYFVWKALKNNESRSIDSEIIFLCIFSFCLFMIFYFVISESPTGAIVCIMGFSGIFREMVQSREGFLFRGLIGVSSVGV